MGSDTHYRRGHPIVTGLLIFFAIIELAISAWLTARYHRYGAPSSLAGRTHFALFTSVWTVVFTFLYGILFWHSAAGSVLTSIASHGIFLLLTWVFWTATAASVTSELGGGLNCNHSPFAYCGQLNALEAFAWIEWILVTFAVITVLIRGITSSRSGNSVKDGLVV